MARKESGDKGENPMNASAHYTRGINYVDISENDKAEADFAKAKELDLAKAKME